MTDDYFVRKSDRKFLQEYHDKCLNFGRIRAKNSSGLTAEEKDEVRKFVHYVNETSGRLSRLMGKFCDIHKDRGHWRNFFEGHEDDTKTMIEWLYSAIGAAKEYERESSIVYSIIGRIADVPFRLLREITHYDVRHNRYFQGGMVYLIVGACLVFLGNEFYGALNRFADLAERFGWRLPK